jgi:hypothetical protein
MQSSEPGVEILLVKRLCKPARPLLALRLANSTRVEVVECWPTLRELLGAVAAVTLHALGERMIVFQVFVELSGFAKRDRGPI